MYREFRLNSSSILYGGGVERERDGGGKRRGRVSEFDLTPIDRWRGLLRLFSIHRIENFCGAKPATKSPIRMGEE